MVFVLHNGADQKYAAELAEALAPIPAIAAPLPEGEAQRLMFGRGAACVLVWSGAASQAEAFASALPEGASAVALALNDNAAPGLLSGRASIVRGAGAPAADAESLRGAIAQMLGALRSRLTGNTRRGASPSLAVPTDTSQADRKPMLARSAFGLTVSLAVVGIGASFISSRTQAASATPNPVETSAAAAPVAAPAVVEAAAAETAVIDAAAIAPVEAAPANAMALGDLTVTAPTPRQTAAAVTYFEPPLAVAAVETPPLEPTPLGVKGQAPALSAPEASPPSAALFEEAYAAPLAVKQRAIAPRLK
ncbi:MAG TPA: hypothetical protein PKY87_07375, partial [Terricaulis sp.]|nr:hypothetical protein [Terricaulis sp.]